MSPKVRRVILIPTELLEAVRRIARREHRSVSAQIVHFLAQAVAAEEGGDAGTRRHEDAGREGS
jgi:hypothetical protein